MYLNTVMKGIELEDPLMISFNVWIWEYKNVMFKNYPDLMQNIIRTCSIDENYISKLIPQKKFENGSDRYTLDHIINTFRSDMDYYESGFVKNIQNIEIYTVNPRARSSMTARRINSGTDVSMKMHSTDSSHDKPQSTTEKVSYQLKLGKSDHTWVRAIWVVLFGRSNIETCIRDCRNNTPENPQMIHPLQLANTGALEAKQLKKFTNFQSSLVSIVQLLNDIWGKDKDENESKEKTLEILSKARDRMYFELNFIKPDTDTGSAFEETHSKHSLYSIWDLKRDKYTQDNIPVLMFSIVPFMKNFVKEYLKNEYAKNLIECVKEIMLNTTTDAKHKSVLKSFTHERIYNVVSEQKSENSFIITNFIELLKVEYENMIKLMYLICKLYVLCINLSDIDLSSESTEIINDINKQMKELSENAFMKASGFQYKVLAKSSEKILPLHKYSSIGMYELFSILSKLESRYHYITIRSLLDDFIFKCIEQVLLNIVNVYRNYINKIISKDSVVYIYDTADLYEELTEEQKGITQIVLCEDIPDVLKHGVCYVKGMSAARVINQILYTPSTIHKFISNNVSGLENTLMKNFRIIVYKTSEAEYVLDKSILNTWNVYPVDMDTVNGDTCMKLLIEQLKVIEANILKLYSDYMKLLEYLHESKENDIIRKNISGMRDWSGKPETDFIKYCICSGCIKMNHENGSGKYGSNMERFIGSYDKNNSIDSIFAKTWITGTLLKNYTEIYKYPEFDHLTDTSTVKAVIESKDSFEISKNIIHTVFQHIPFTKIIDSTVDVNVDTFDGLTEEAKSLYNKQLRYMIAGSDISDSNFEKVYKHYIENAYMYTGKYEVENKLSEAYDPSTFVIYSEIDCDGACRIIQQQDIISTDDIETEYIFAPYVPNVLNPYMISFNYVGDMTVENEFSKSKPKKELNRFMVYDSGSSDVEEDTGDGSTDVQMNLSDAKTDSNMSDTLEDTPKNEQNKKSPEFTPDYWFTADDDSDTDTKQKKTKRINTVKGGARENILKQIIFYISMFVLIILLIVLLVKIIKKISAPVQRVITQSV